MSDARDGPPLRGGWPRGGPGLGLATMLPGVLLSAAALAVTPGEQGGGTISSSSSSSDALSELLARLHFDNGGTPAPVRREQTFAHLPQCNMYWEPANVSTTLWAWTDQWFSPFGYLYEVGAGEADGN